MTLRSAFYTFNGKKITIGSGDIAMASPTSRKYINSNNEH